MSLHMDLLSQARRLAKLDPQRPRQANLRRAVSSAYYALFHYLIDQACRTVIDTHQVNLPYRQVIARSFEHGSMKQACKVFGGGTLPQFVLRGLPAGFSVPSRIRNAASTFVDLQELRHTADYDLTRNFTRSEVLTLVQLSDQARVLFHSESDRVKKKFFLACLMTWKTLGNRG